MSALKELNQDTVHFVCDEIFNWDKRTQDSLLTAAIGKRYNDDDIFSSRCINIRKLFKV